ncbi:MAG: hypothetical protein IJ631_03965 [Schwartzia sp.]|nr:hypothetical protein [Schwartzia sp. (in: firmicutes)]
MAKKEQSTRQNEPWKGLMTKKNYDIATEGMSAKDKREFNRGLEERDTNFLMGLAFAGLYDPRKNPPHGKTSK